jgi:fermentation-respiration switch protein FrsA (DUF1100 family)
MLRAVLVAAGVVVLLLALLTGLLWAFQRSRIYLPDAGPVQRASDVLPGARDTVLVTDDGLELAAWYLPGPSTGSAAVLVANGNGGHRGLRAPLARALNDAGSPTEEGLARDVRAARRFLVEDAGAPADRLVYFGESLGAAVVTELATEHPPAGLVLRSPFVDLASVASTHYPFLPARALLRDRYPVAEALSVVDVPTTVIYGTADTIVPPEQSRAVAEAAAQLHDVIEVPGADHNDAVLLDGEAVVDAVLELAG